ncbi:sulfate adenylyltransferase subunit CysD [Trinickia soli]|uniref:sulfate adenylyltransferase subunit CysD n=1 Tax=Trinickia soli TaxID=380675 RepID=UPI0012583CAF|nr:sulfate adenylyltransferase subunit CysD [Paraburkholderia sp. T12-10]
MIDLHGLDAPVVWTTELAFDRLKKIGVAQSKRTAERRLHELRILPAELAARALMDGLGRPANRLLVDWVIQQARARRQLVLFAQLATLPTGQRCLHANDARGTRYWLPLTEAVHERSAYRALQQIQQHIDRELTLLATGDLVELLRTAPPPKFINFLPQAYLPTQPFPKGETAPPRDATLHLRRLEDESVYILREAVAEAQNPVMLYAIDKESEVILHLARKAFHPAPIPFPLLHVDTRWNFQDMYLFRDSIAGRHTARLLTYVNPEAITANINPFDHGELHKNITMTESLKHAMNYYKFDVAFGGTGNDPEEPTTNRLALSFRTPTHHRVAANQRPELWNLYNISKVSGETVRVFPLAKWSELDIWLYIRQENIPVVPLYFAKHRPVVVRSNMIIMIDDDRCQLLPDDEIQIRKVRFPSVGCYPLTAAIESDAETVDDVLLELINGSPHARQCGNTDASKVHKKRNKPTAFF